uniref:Vomeronasal 2, receptor 65 n=1 Tax=Mus musculus TaxID=10090 RepID=A0A3B2WCT5_MOUSE
MLSFMSFFLILEYFLLLSVAHPKCFWRIKQNENKVGDVEDNCFFYIYTRQGPLLNDPFNGNPDILLTTRNIHLILALLFAIKQINRNIHILPNISLIVNVNCAKKEDLQMTNMYSNRDATIPNYNCKHGRRILTVLTGPRWFSSAILGPFLHIFAIPQVAPFLENNKFIIPSEYQYRRGKLDTEYDILYAMDLLPALGLNVKIGKFSQHFLHFQQLYIAEDMIDWTIDIRQTLQSVCSVPCSVGFRKFIQKGKAVCCFDCTPCPENEISNMTDMDQCVKCPNDQYANIKQTHCLKKVVTFLAYEDPLGMTLTCLALLFSALTTVILSILLKHQDNPIVKANNRLLSYILLISLIFCFLCSLLYIGHPHMATCILQQTTFAVVFTVAVSTILAKTITVVMAFKITDPRKKIRQMLVTRAPNYIIPICTMIQLILCGTWIGTSPPFVDSDPHFEHGHIIIVCNKGSVIAFYCVLGYLGLLALGSFTVAFLARNLPDRFNEAKFLTFSMLVFCSVWITFLPVYHSTKGKAMVVVEIFSILTSSAGLLVCIFFPKCFTILLKQKVNFTQKFSDTHSKIEYNH